MSKFCLASRWYANQPDDARVRLPVYYGQRAKILVLGNQDALLTVGEFEYFLIARVGVPVA